MPRRFGTSKDRKTMYFSLVSPLDPNSHTKYKPYLHMKNHHDRLFVIDLGSAKNSQEIYQTANGSVLCYGTVPSEFLTEIIEGSERFGKEQYKEEESSPTKKSRCEQRSSKRTKAVKSMFNVINVPNEADCEQLSTDVDRSLAD